MLVNKAYKFRMYPTFSQKALISKTFGCSRLIFNKMLDKKLEDPSITRFDMNKLILH